MGAELFSADSQTDITKLIVAFRNFAKAPKNLILANQVFLLMMPCLCLSVFRRFEMLYAFTFQWPRSLIMKSQVMLTYKQYSPTLHT
jgi:hypothetical protein